MTKDAEIKRAKHTKKISEVEKKQPIFIDNLKSAIANVRLKTLTEPINKNINTIEQLNAEIDGAIENYNQKEFQTDDLAQLYKYLD